MTKCIIKSIDRFGARGGEENSLSYRNEIIFI